MEPSNDDEIYPVMIICPTTGTPGAVGAASDAQLAAMTDGPQWGGCGACHGNHQWRKSDAYLEKQQAS